MRTDEEIPGAGARLSAAMNRALLVVDVQRDFCEGGSLAVEGGNAVAAMIAEYLASPAASQYAHIVATRDHHIDPGSHFSAHPDFVDSWPPHCVAGTPGSDFHPALDASRFEEVFLKGQYAAAYSGFEGCSSGVAGSHGERGVGQPGAQPGGQPAADEAARPAADVAGQPAADEAGQPLAEWLHSRGVAAVDIAGIATDYCVKTTAADAIGAGFSVRVLIDMTAGVNADTTAKAVQEMISRGAEVRGGRAHSA